MVPDSRKARRADRLEQRRKERARRKSGATSDGGGRNVWLALGSALVVGVLLVGVLVVGFAGDDDNSTTATAGTGSSTSAGGDFPLVAYQGADVLGASELDFTELLGTGTPVVLNFWAGQCPPCRAEMPAFQNVYDTYSDDFLLVGVDVGPFIGLGTRQSAIDLLAELDITYPAAGAETAQVVQDYNVVGMPTTIFYDGEGVETDRHTGILTEQALEARVRELIGPSA